jgi:hypothetical protein
VENGLSYSWIGQGNLSAELRDIGIAGLGGFIPIYAD